MVPLPPTSPPLPQQDESQEHLLQAQPHQKRMNKSRMTFLSTYDSSVTTISITTATISSNSRWYLYWMVGWLSIGMIHASHGWNRHRNRNPFVVPLPCRHVVGISTIRTMIHPSSSSSSSSLAISSSYLSDPTKEIETMVVPHHPDGLLLNLRGGSTDQSHMEQSENKKDVADRKIKESSQTADDGNEEEEEHDDDDDDDDVQHHPIHSVISSQPVKLWIQTNWGSKVLDHKFELLAARTRNIASLKQSISRMLPGRPPVLGLELVYEGSILEDEMLIDELMDDDEDEDEDEDGASEEKGGKTLLLNIVPPVDPKFATELIPKLKPHAADDEDTLTTQEILDAYFLNQVAMSRNALLLSNPLAPSSPLIRLELQEQAKQLQEQFRSQIPEKVWEASMAPVSPSLHKEERRGQRYRSGKGGARTSLRKSIQHNLNIVRIHHERSIVAGYHTLLFVLICFVVCVVLDAASSTLLPLFGLVFCIFSRIGILPIL